MRHPWPFRAIAGTLLLLAVAPLRAADAPPTFATRVAAARALSAEGSHALAAAAFAEALALAPDDEQKRWTRLWIVAEQVAEVDGVVAIPAIARELEELLAPYAQGDRPRDAFWAAAREVSASEIPQWGRDRALQARLEVANYWSLQPSSPAAQQSFARATIALGRAVGQAFFPKDTPGVADALDFLRRAAAILAPGPARAEVALHYASALEIQRRNLALDPDQITRAFATAREEARDTTLAAEAAVRHASWLLRQGPFGAGEQFVPQPTDQPRRSRDIPREEYERALALIDDALATTPAAPGADLARLVAELRRRRVALLNPSLHLDLSSAFLPSSRLSFGVVATHIPALELKLYRVEADALHAIAFTPHPASAPVPDELRRATPLRVWTVDTQVGGRMGRATTRQSWREPLAPGFYVLVVHDPGSTSASPTIRWFTVTGIQALAQSAGPDLVDVCAFDQETGQPIPAVHGKFWAARESRSLVSVEPGRAQVSLRGLERPMSGYHVIGEAAGQPFVIPSVWRTSEARPEWRLHLRSDRPLYRPGETAQWKLTARELADGQLRVPEGARLTIAAKSDEGDTTLETWHVTLNSFGSASGKLALPIQLLPGQVRFDVQLEGERRPERIEAFLVDNFRAPETTLTIAPVDPDQIRRARPGRDVEFALDARYFSGEPLTNADVAVTANFFRIYPMLDDFGRRRVEAPAEMPKPLSLTAVIDGKGQARLRVPLPTNLPRHSLVALRARLTGTGLNAQAELDFKVLPSGYVATLASAAQPAPAGPSEADRYSQAAPPVPALYAAPGQPVALALYARDGRHARVAVKGDVTIVRQVWEEIWRAPDGRFLTGGPLRDLQARSPVWPPRDGPAVAGWEKIRAAYRTETVNSAAVATDATGRAPFSCPPLVPGYYHVLYHDANRALDDDQPAARLELFVAESSTEWLSYHDEDPRVIPCADPQPPGQPIRALVVLPGAGRHALLHLNGVASAASRLAFFPGNTRIVEFPWRPDYWAGARVDVAMLAATHDGTGGTAIALSRESHAALVALQPDPAPGRPGGKTRMKIRTTDSAGRPISSEVALAVADAAVTSLLADKLTPIGDDFLEASSVWPAGVARSAAPVFLGSTEVPGLGGTLAPEAQDTVTLSPFEVSTAGSNSYYGTAGAAQFVQQMNVKEAGDSTRVRTRFSHTAFWGPEIATDDRGEATVEFTYPDNLTEWRVDAEAIAADNRFGTAQVTTRTSLPLQARLRLPRALVAGDAVTLFGGLVNGTADPAVARGELLSPAGSVFEIDGPDAQNAVLPAAGEATLAWDARVPKPGTATLRFTGRSLAATDAVELTIPVQEDGFLQRTSVSGRTDGAPLALTLTLPAPLRAGRTAVELQLSPGIAPALIEALPYLVDYPYGCVEQTVSRFLPAALVAKTLRELGLRGADVERRILASRQSMPRGRPASAGLVHLDEVIARSLTSLVEARQPGGSFGWFPGGTPDAYMTSYVLRGLNVAAAAGIALPADLHRETFAATLEFLETAPGENSPLRLAWILAAATGYAGQREQRQTDNLNLVFNALHATRSRLPPAGIALLAQAGHALHRTAELPMLRRNLESGVLRGRSAESGETAQWGQSPGYFDGLEGPVETTALCLQALLVLEPKAPLADAAANWLLVNRQSGAWHNTRDTTLALLALLDYARDRGSFAVHNSQRVQVTVNGRALAPRTFDRDSLLEPVTLLLDPALLRPGQNQITVERTGGDAPCFALAMSRSWAESDSTRPAGEFLKVAREFVRLAEQPSLIGMVVTRPEPLPAMGAALPRNERVECRLVVEVQHDLEYVIVESPKPGGCEPLNPLSGWDATLRRLGPLPADEVGEAKSGTANASAVYREEHDDRSVFFLPQLAAGRWEIRYTMRAVFPGDFRALPATGAAMYVPSIAANTAAMRLAIMAQKDPASSAPSAPSTPRD